jgi:hypothetical protein
MTIFYVTPGPWGAGTGAQNSAAQVDGNFWDVDQRVVALQADLDEGKRIDTVTYTDVAMTFHFTDGSSQVIPLPVATLNYIGEWSNSTPLNRSNLFSVNAFGFYQVLQDHITPAAPAAFDPNAVDDTTAGNPLYQLWFPLRDINYDAVLFTPGSIQREPDELLFSGIANRAMQLKNGNLGAYAYLDVGNEGSGATDIIISIQKNRVEIGTITFEANGDIDTAGGQPGVFSIPLTTDFAANDVYSLRVTQSDNATPAGLSITLPFLRMDI